MEKTSIWYYTDNDKNKKLVQAIASLGLTINEREGMDLENANIVEGEINILIFDFLKLAAGTLIKKISECENIQSFLKFIILVDPGIKKTAALSFNILHLEFISRPVRLREFMLLLEKSIVVERYREILKNVSREAESKIEIFEGMLDVNRKNVFGAEKVKEAFGRIINHEKNLIREQSQLNRSIKNFSFRRQKEKFGDFNRSDTGDVLDDIRKKDSAESQLPVKTGGGMAEMPEQAADAAGNSADTTGHIAKVSISSAIELRLELERSWELNKNLSREIDTLLRENEKLKSRLHA